MATHNRDPAGAGDSTFRLPPHLIEAEQPVLEIELVESYLQDANK